MTTDYTAFLVRESGNPATEKQISYLTDLLTQVQTHAAQLTTRPTVDTNGDPIDALAAPKAFFAALALPDDLTSDEASGLISVLQSLARRAANYGLTIFAEDSIDAYKNVKKALKQRARQRALRPNGPMPSLRYLDSGAPAEGALLVCQTSANLAIADMGSKS